MKVFSPKFLTGALWSFLDKVINQFSLLAITIYLASRLGPEIFGLLGILSVFLLIGDSIVNSGLGQALIQRSKDVTSVQYSTVFIFNIMLAVLVYCILYALSPFISDFYSIDELEPASKLIFLVIVLNSLSVVDRAKLTIDLDFKSIAKATFIGNLVGGSTAIVLVNNGYDESYVPLVWMSIIRVLFTTLILRFSSKLKLYMKFDASEFKVLFHFGYKLLIAGVISAVSNNIYTLIVGKFFDSKSVGYYSQSSNLTNTLSAAITSIVQGVSFPVMTEVKNERKKLIALYQKLIKSTMLIICPVMLGLVAVANDFVVLFLGVDWLPIINLVSILAISKILTPVSAINMNVLNAIGRSDLYLKVDLIKLPFSLTVIVIGSFMGIYYLAIGVLIMTLFAFVVNAYYPGKILGVGLFSQLNAMSKPILASVIMLLAVLSIDVEPSFIGLLAKIVLGVFIYLFSLILIREEEAISVLNYVFKVIFKRKVN
ncbi:lipopolysaccharide biosynthesis protein [Vibrio vulnificus]|nr:lipopolysaccharide biosynthesis protein [Vibrio vulnificus]